MQSYIAAGSDIYVHLLAIITGWIAVLISTREDCQYNIVFQNVGIILLTSRVKSTKRWSLVLPGSEFLHALLQQILILLFFTDDGCGHYVLGQESGVLSSKNYPRTYPNNSWCEWRIRVPIGHTIILKFGDMDLEKKDCESDYLKVLKGSYGTENGERLQSSIIVHSSPLSCDSAVVTRSCGFGQIIYRDSQLHTLIYYTIMIIFKQVSQTS